MTSIVPDATFFFPQFSDRDGAFHHPCLFTERPIMLYNFCFNVTLLLFIAHVEAVKAYLRVWRFLSTCTFWREQRLHC